MFCFKKTFPFSQNTYSSENTSYNQYNTDQSSGSYSRRSDSEQNQEYKKTDESQTNYQANGNHSSDYYAALNLVMLDKGYTIDELKKQRNRFLKSFHPDEGTEETKKYNYLSIVANHGAFLRFLVKNNFF